MLSEADFEICFDNRHELVDNKKLVWEFDILGDEDEEVVLAVNHTMEEYMFQADLVRLENNEQHQNSVC